MYYWASDCIPPLSSETRDHDTKPKHSERRREYQASPREEHSKTKPEGSETLLALNGPTRLDGCGSDSPVARLRRRGWKERGPPPRAPGPPPTLERFRRGQPAPPLLMVGHQKRRKDIPRRRCCQEPEKLVVVGVVVATFAVEAGGQ